MIVHYHVEFEEKRSHVTQIWLDFVLLMSIRTLSMQSGTERTSCAGGKIPGSLLHCSQKDNTFGSGCTTGMIWIFDKKKL